MATVNVQASDVQARWLPVGTAPNDDVRLEVLIADIVDDARTRIHDFDDRVDDGRIREATLKRVISQAVIRVWKRGYDPRASFSEATGPFSASGTFEGANEPALTQKEVETLAPDLYRSSAFKLELAPNAGSVSEVVTFGGARMYPTTPEGVDYRDA